MSWHRLVTVMALALASSVFAGAQAPADAPYPGSGLTRQQLMDKLTAPAYVPKPSIDEGKKTYQALCAGCHQFGDLGTSVGPDLSTVGSRFKRKDILDSILWPSRTISDQYVMTVVALQDGTTQSGFIVREDNQYLYLRTADHLEGRGLPIPVANIKDRANATVSLMPEGLVAPLTLAQIDNLVGFLLTGK